MLPGERGSIMKVSSAGSVRLKLAKGPFVVALCSGNFSERPPILTLGVRVTRAAASRAMLALPL
jgi:hypothetical protein